jgi:hypothetical protein
MSPNPQFELKKMQALLGGDDGLLSYGIMNARQLVHNLGTMEFCRRYREVYELLQSASEHAQREKP